MKSILPLSVLPPFTFQASNWIRRRCLNLRVVAIIDSRRAQRTKIGRTAVIYKFNYRELEFRPAICSPADLYVTNIHNSKHKIQSQKAMGKDKGICSVYDSKRSEIN